MAGKKIYAVRKGRKTGIFFSWADCKAAVDGFTGAEYKGFLNLEEAKAFLGESAADGGMFMEDVKTASEKELPGNPDRLLAYVDGSYEHSLRKYAFGCVFIFPDGRVYTENGSGDNPDSAALRNVTGEMLGAMFAVRFAINNGFSEIELRYDYEGIEKWVTGAWRSRTDLTQKYARAMQGWSRAVKIIFTKVAAHTNVYYNEMADQLAKGALEKETGIPEVRKAEDMIPEQNH